MNAPARDARIAGRTAATAAKDFSLLSLCSIFVLLKVALLILVFVAFDPPITSDSVSKAGATASVSLLLP